MLFQPLWLILLVCLAGLICVALELRGIEHTSKLIGHYSSVQVAAVYVRNQMHTLTAFLFAISMALITVSAIAIDRELRLSRILTDISKSTRWLAKQFNMVPRGEPSLTALQGTLDQLGVELSESRRREKLLFERAVDVICIVDLNGLIMSVSPSVKRNWGYAPIDLEGRSLGSVLRLKDAERILEDLQDSFKSIDKLQFESQIRKKDGTMLDVSFTGHWSASEAGLFCIVHDISRQKRVENQARQNEQRIRAALESLPVAVLVADHYGEVEFANTEAHEILGYPPDGLMGVKLSGLFDQQGLTDDRQSYEGSIPTVAHCRDGTARSANVWLTPLEQEEAERKMLIAFVDTTGQERFEKEKREFLAMVAHDLRTPLSTVIGMLSLVEQGVLGNVSDQGKRIAAGAYNECNRMLRLLNDMLDIEKITTGNFELKCAHMNISTTVWQALETLGTQAKQKQLSLETDLKNANCWGDEQRLAQVIINLLTNAIKYAPDGSTVRVASMDFGPLVMVTVEDHGPGIPTDKIDKIFERFGQVDLADARERGGTGLGLAICKAIVTQHGGQIGVETQPGKGSRFWFTVPKDPEFASGEWKSFPRSETFT